jgi:hypothetical protein
MAFESVWGFDPDKTDNTEMVSLWEIGANDCLYTSAEQQAARIPSNAGAQVYELRRMFRL